MGCSCRCRRFHCVVISEGILSVQQVEEDAERWTKYLSEEYNLDQEMLLDSFRVIKTMDENRCMHLLNY